MGHYVRDWKDISVTYEGKRYELRARFNLGERGGYNGLVASYQTKNEAIWKVVWGFWFVEHNGLPLVTYYNSKNEKVLVTKPMHLEVMKKCVLIYQDKMNEEKEVSTCPRVHMTDEERQEAIEAKEAREQVEYDNYSSSIEYESGTPYLFYLCKDKTVCAKDSDKVTTYVRATTIKDDYIVQIYKKYRDTCRDCNKRKECRLECLSQEERNYIYRYIANMVDSQEVQDFYKKEVAVC